MCGVVNGFVLKIWIQWMWFGSLIIMWKTYQKPQTLLIFQMILSLKAFKECFVIENKFIEVSKLIFWGGFKREIGWNLRFKLPDINFPIN